MKPASKKKAAKRKLEHPYRPLSHLEMSTLLATTCLRPIYHMLGMLDSKNLDLVFDRVREDIIEASRE